jgi:hypothetical protein
MLVKYLLTVGPSVKEAHIYKTESSRFRGADIWKTDFYAWKKGRLSPRSATCQNLERFLKAGNAPVKLAES